MNIIKINKFFKFNLFFGRKQYLFAIILIIAAVGPGCKKEAKTVFPAEYTANVPTNPNAGYYYPVVIDHYPKATDANIPINTKFIIIFNIPVNGADFTGGISLTSSIRGSLSDPADYTIIPVAGYARSATITFTSNLADNEEITVNVSNTIRDAENNVPMPNSYIYSFTIPVGATPDVTGPVEGGAHVPASGATGVSRTAPGITVVFSENIDASTVNSSTFYLTDSTLSTVSAQISGTGTSFQLFPVDILKSNEVYTVHITGSIKDLSGNAYTGATSWTFTTIATNPDPVAGAPAFTGGPEIVSLSTNSFTLQWTTSEVANYSLSYGRNTTVSDGPATAADFFSSRNVPVTVNPGDEGKRIWYRVDVEDIAGNSNSSAVYQINLYTTEATADLHAGVNNQYSLKTVPYNPPNANSGSALFWTHNTGSYIHIYGQVFNSIGNKLWGDPQPLFTDNANFSGITAADDGIGGMIVVAVRGGNEIRAKRLNSSGAFVDWGATANTATAPGFLIGTGSKGGAAIVYSGLLQQLMTGQVDEGGLAMSNPFFEDLDVDGAGASDTLSDYAVNSDILYDITDGDAALIVKTAAWDHEYILGQSAAIYTASHNYTLADNTTSSATTITDHDMNVTDRLEDNQTFYLPHGYVKPAWLTTGSNAIAFINSSDYARVTNVNTVTVTAIDSGTETAKLGNHLYDVNVDFTGAGISQYDLVEDTTDIAYAVITGTISLTSDLTLGNSIFTAAEGYTFYPLLASGTATFGSVGTLIDSSATFITSCSVGDLIFEVDGTDSIIAGPYTINTINSNTSIITSGGSFSDGDRYRIYSQTSFGGGNADNGGNIIINTAANWSGVSVGDLVRNTTDLTFSTVTEKSDTVLKLNDSRFDGVAGSLEGYQIYHEFCTTHNTYAEQVADFYEIVLDKTIGTMASGQSVTFYNEKLSWTADASSNVFPTNPIYEDDNTFTGLMQVISGDIVFNYSSGSKAYIDTGTYALHPYAMSLSSDIFSADNQEYRVYGYYLDSLYANYMHTGMAGIADLSPAGHLMDAGLTASEGDVAFNALNQTYGLVTAVVAGNLTLSWDCFTAGSEPYFILNRSGVFFVWLDGTNVMAKIISASLFGAETAPVDLVTAVIIAPNSSNPYVIPDGQGNAYVIYVSTTGTDQIMVGFYNGAMTQLWAAHRELDTGVASDEAIIDVKSDGNGGVVVLYTYGTELKMQRISSVSHITIPPATTNIDRLWTATGRSVTALANSQQRFAYDSGSDSAVVVWNNSNNIWARRINGTLAPAALQITNLATVERDPSVYLEAGGQKALVVWDDSRFIANASYGVFGIKLNVTLATGVLSKDTAWNANEAGGTVDQNGIALVLNNFNESAPYPLLAPYDNGTDILLFWADYQTSGNGSDLIYMNPFAPVYVPVW